MPVAAHERSIGPGRTRPHPQPRRGRGQARRLTVLRQFRQPGDALYSASPTRRRERARSPTVALPHRRHRRRPGQPAAALGGLDGRRLGALRGRPRHDRRPEPRRRGRAAPAAGHEPRSSPSSAPDGCAPASSRPSVDQPVYSAARSSRDGDRAYHRRDAPMRCTPRSSTRRSIGTSDGSPRQRFVLSTARSCATAAPVPRGGRGRRVAGVDGGRRTSPDAPRRTTALLVDGVDGQIVLGPSCGWRTARCATTARCRPKGAVLRMRSLRGAGGGAAGNVNSGAISVLTSSIPYIDRVENRHPRRRRA